MIASSHDKHDIETRLASFANALRVDAGLCKYSEIEKYLWNVGAAALAELAAKEISTLRKRNESVTIKAGK